ncbi:MAG: M48 family metalloprotease [Acidobacteriaceae bacterium]|nr:M48 family metalloprotease [Acidobacteriaceae bacterium]
MTAGLGFLKMSRAAERQADLEGVGILYDAGYDPHGLPQFFETIQAKYGSGGAQFLSDHPNPGNRTEYVDKEIATFVPRPNYVTTSVAFQRIKAQVADMHAYTARELSSGAWKTQSPNRPVNTGVNEAVSENAAAPDVNTASAWKEFRGSEFTLMIPVNWTGYGNSLAAMFAPPGGFGRSPDGRAGNVIYGMLTDRYRSQQNLRDDAALDELIREITRDNPGVQPGAQAAITVNGVHGRSLESENPSANNGRGEHDWVVAFPLRDGSLRYFVFVAPTPEFVQFRPTFQRILQSLRIQS